ncbi:MAG TPA: glycosyltransferase [Lacunisphaera sp.]|nr:glycosyltransferase [Lacunisphaera sp.]
MRIYLAFFQTLARGPGTANYGFWADMLRAGLQEAGHTVLETAGLDWAEGMSVGEAAELRAWRDRAWTRALADLATHQAAGGVDLFLGYFFPKQVETGALVEIARRGIPTVNFFCDNVREFRTVPAAYRSFTLHWVPEWEAVSLYAAAGLRCLHAPMPVWVPPAARTLPTQEEPIATFLGSRDDLRADLFGRLARHGGRVRIHGKGWVRGPAGEPGAAPRPQASFVASQWRYFRHHGLAAWLRKFSPRPARSEPPPDWLGAPVPRDEYFRLTRESAVTVGVNRFDSPRVPRGRIATYSRLRDLEAPMLGACYLTEWAAGLDRLYDLDREIAVYRDEAGLAEHINALLADPPRRARMRRAAQARALGEHSIGPTLAKIAAAVGLSPAAPR